MKVFLTALLMVVFVGQKAQADVFGKNGEVIKVERVQIAGETQISFEYCDRRNYCRPLGSKQFYTEKELRSQKTIESFQAALTGVGAIIGVVGATYAGGALLVAAIPSSVGSGVTGFVASLAADLGTMFLGGALGAAGGTFAVVSIDQINPRVQYRQARVIRNKVLRDEDVQIATRNGFAKFLKELETVLEKF
jgi:hypothetical protein